MWRQGHKDLDHCLVLFQALNRELGGMGKQGEEGRKRKERLILQHHMWFQEGKERVSEEQRMAGTSETCIGVDSG